MGIFDYFSNKRKEKEQDMKDQALYESLSRKIEAYNNEETKSKFCQATDLTEYTDVIIDGKKIRVDKATILENTDTWWDRNDPWGSADPSEKGKWKKDNKG